MQGFKELMVVELTSQNEKLTTSSFWMSSNQQKTNRNMSCRDQVGTSGMSLKDPAGIKSVNTTVLGCHVFSFYHKN